MRCTSHLCALSSPRAGDAIVIAPGAGLLTRCGEGDVAEDIYMWRPRASCNCTVLLLGGEGTLNGGRVLNCLACKTGARARFATSEGRDERGSQRARVATSEGRDERGSRRAMS